MGAGTQRPERSGPAPLAIIAIVTLESSIATFDSGASLSVGRLPRPRNHRVLADAPSVGGGPLRSGTGPGIVAKPHESDGGDRRPYPRTVASWIEPGRIGPSRFPPSIRMGHCSSRPPVGARDLPTAALSRTHADMYADLGVGQLSLIRALRRPVAAEAQSESRGPVEGVRFRMKVHRLNPLGESVAKYLRHCSRPCGADPPPRRGG